MSDGDQCESTELTITIDEFTEGFRDAMQRAFDNAESEG